MLERKLHFKGSHKEIGEQVGLKYKEWGRTKVSIAHLADEYFPKQLSIYNKYFPSYIEYLEGVAIGQGIEKELAMKAYLTNFLPIAWKPKNACSTFALKNNSGVLIGRNYDWGEATEESSRFYEINYTDNSANSFKAVSDMGVWEFNKPANPLNYVLISEDAWNDRGLYIGLNGTPGDEQSFGMSNVHLVQLVAESCDNTEDAVSLIEQVPIPEAKMFTIADKTGNLAVVEKTIDKGAKVRMSNKIIFTTNHFNHPDFVKLNEQIFGEIPFHSTFSRYAYLDIKLSNYSEEMDINKILEIMSKPPVVQNWRGASNGDTVTAWSLALNLNTESYKVILSPQTKKFTAMFS